MPSTVRIEHGRLRFHCPTCHNPMSAMLAEAGQAYTCAKCEQTHTVPAATHETPRITHHEQPNGLAAESDEEPRTHARARDMRRRAAKLQSWRHVFFNTGAILAILLGAAIVLFIGFASQANETEWSVTARARVPANPEAKAMLGPIFTFGIACLPSVILSFAAAAAFDALAHLLRDRAETLLTDA